MSIFNDSEVFDFLNDSQIGLWEITFEKDNVPRFYANEMMDKLLGCPKDITPEERFVFHRSNICKDDIELFEEYAGKLLYGQSEVTYRYNHPKFGTMFVRCGGKKDTTYKEYTRIKGMHQDISGTFRLENDKIAEKFLAEKNFHLEEQLEIIHTLAKTYNSIYYIDMKTGMYVKIGVQLAGVNSIIGGAGDAQDALNTMCDKIIVPEQADEMREFSDLSTVNERLKGKIYIAKQFKGNISGWSEGYIIAAKRDKDGNCEHIIWATRTIDESKRREIAYHEALQMATKAAQAANEAKTAFLFNMSHDIRTPMNAIIGYTNLIEKNIDDRELCKDYLTKIMKASDFLLSLINNVLEMARIESGKLSLEERAWSVKGFCEAMYSIFENPMKEKGIDFVINIDVEHNTVFCDPVKLREVFLNIISNANKYTQRGGTVTLSVEETECYKEGYACIKVSVEDTGIGMSKEFLPTLFEEFSRERNHTDSKIEGTGLGMPIVKRLVELMGGTINVESELGKGTKIDIVTCHRIADTDETEYENFEEINDISFKGKRILLAEDNELNAEIAVEILHELGTIVDVAEDGVMCIEMLTAAAPSYYDIILMDVQMPNMNGYETTKVIRTFDGEKGKIPIVAMTANAFDEDKKKATEVGMNGHLAKPIGIKTLIRELVKYLG